MTTSRERVEASWALLLRSWERSLRARNLSPATISKYAESGRQLVAHLLDNGEIGPDQVRREHVEEWIAHLAATRSASTASVRYRSVQQLFTYLLEEEEIAADPMARMRPPLVPEKPVPVLALDDAQRLLKTCDSKGFVDRRDAAILRLFLDTGVRLGELSALSVDDVDLEASTSRSCSGRDAGRGRARSARGPARRSTGTCGCVLDTFGRPNRRCGWQRRTGRHSRRTASPRW